MEQGLSIHPYGDAALIVESAGEISEAAYGPIRSLAEALDADRPKALVELIPAYRSLLVVYDPMEADYASMEARVRSRIRDAAGPRSEERIIVHVPVCYDPPHSPDLEEAARHTGLTPEEVVELHSSQTYLVFMLGFTPGFPYLGGMTERIAVPRRASPRTRIPAGSVGIADRQTGIYPAESPGGWNIIGRTPAVLFDPERDPPALLAAGQYVRFHPISSGEFERLASAANSGEWRPGIERPAGARE